MTTSWLWLNNHQEGDCVAECRERRIFLPSLRHFYSGSG